MFVDAEDWFARLKRAGGTIRVDAVSIYPRDPNISSDCEAIWNEIRGADNEKNWQQVKIFLRQKVGRIVGWANL